MNIQLTYVKNDDDETTTMKGGYEKYANHFRIKGLYEL